MNTFDLLRVQHYDMSPGPEGVPVARMSKIEPYVRLSQGSNPPLYAKQGRIYGEGGQVIDIVPDWFWEQARKVSRETRASVRLQLPEEAEAPRPALEPEILPAPKTRPAPRRGRTRRVIDIAGSV